MDKRGLCAFDNKRILLDDGIHTLAIGHKQVTAEVNHDRVENPGGDTIMKEKEARRAGLIWSRRPGAEKRAGVDLSQRPEEDEDEAVEAGQQMRVDMNQMLAQIPDFPDRYNPEEAAGPSQRRQSLQREENTTRPKRRRVQFSNDLEQEEQVMDQLESNEDNPERELQDARAIVHETSESIVDLEQLFAGVGNGDISENEVDRINASAPMRARIRRSNPFILDEAAEGDERDTQSPSLRTSTPDPSENLQNSISEQDSNSDIDSEDSFVVDDDNFE